MRKRINWRYQMSEPVLVILAAGMGSRFGGLKQMSKMGLGGEWILDFSLFDAKAAGFKKVIFVIQKQMKEAFEKTIGARIAPYFEVVYAYQYLGNVSNIHDLKGRDKPWGTGHALLSAKPYISGPFAVINADDYYGPQAYQKIYAALSQMTEISGWPNPELSRSDLSTVEPQKIQPLRGLMVGYPLHTTLSSNGAVSRGLCTVDEAGYLTEVIELTQICKNKEGLAEAENGVQIELQALVSMNIWGFQAEWLTLLEQHFEDFVKTTLPKSPLTAEFYLPECVNAAVVSHQTKVKVENTTDQWLGITYAADQNEAAQTLQSYQLEGLYPLRLWEDFELSAFPIMGKVLDFKPINNGHINRTYLVSAQESSSIKRYVLQQINTNVFPAPLLLMENIEKVTGFVAQQLESMHGDKPNGFRQMQALQLIRTKEDKTCWVSGSGQYWRLYDYVENSVTAGETSSLEDLRSVGRAFGAFQYLLRDFPAKTLHEVIPNFHHTPTRYLQLEEAIENDPKGRVKQAEVEILFAKAMSAQAGLITSALESGKIPLRVTHNDTKVNNVLLDETTRAGLCVIDLDTVMPGSALYDYGDGIRSSVSTAAEDEENLSIVTVDRNRYSAFTEGFMAGMADTLTPAEIELMPMAAVLMTYECGIRFLTDYLKGDVYFSTSKPEHNLFRARTQFKLVKELMALNKGGI